MKKLLFMIIFIMLLHHAGAKDASNQKAAIISMQPSRPVYSSGEDVSVKIEYKVKSGWVFTGFGVLGYFPYIPEECISCGKFKVIKRHEKRWSSVRFLNFKWFAQNSIKDNTALQIRKVTFSTQDWPVGDYGIHLIMMFRNSAAKNTDIYLQKRFFITITDNQNKNSKR